MLGARFDSLFSIAAGTSRDPFPYQRQLATESALPVVLNVPTGAGKTAAVIAAWIWRRHVDPQSTPRRLVYALPMRVLVEQTAATAREMLQRLGLLYEGPPDPSKPGIRVAILMGGHVDEAWWLEPEREAILVGTVDMLVSRALNRGYALSRYRWPVDFGLLNSDVLWVFDEVQLLGVSLYTSLQLQGLRRLLGTYGPTHTLWCSATVDLAALETVDHPAPEPHRILTLGPEDRRHPVLQPRLSARKVVRRLQLGRGSRRADRPSDTALARAILDAHRPGTRTLVVVNTVDRAQRLYAELHSITKGTAAPEVGLLHSRFRPADRVARQQQFLGNVPQDGPGQILVTTQVVEAGVDVSSATLFTEVAPWESVVQRLGRCNRYGEVVDGAQVFWVDVSDREAAPYEAEALQAARHLLAEMEGASASPQALEGIRPHAARSPVVVTGHVLRRRDLVGLFDTTPDLTGQHLDVSRFIREGADLDVFLYWREWPVGQQPPRQLPSPVRSELCPVPVYEARKMLQEGHRQAWLWDPLAESGQGGWVVARPADIRPGQVLLLHTSQGGYQLETGWTPESREPVPVVTVDGKPSPSSLSGSPQEPADSDEGVTTPERWVTLVDHTRDVIDETEALLASLGAAGIGQDEARVLRVAAAYHDVGKAHEQFQLPLIEAAPEAEREMRARELWAKAPSLGRRRRRPFRHELASALALLQSPPPDLDGELLDLAAFLVAAHHGKVRLVIRSLPTEELPSDGRRHALGVYEGDSLGPVRIAGAVSIDRLTLDLSLMEIGLSAAGGISRRSWMDRMVALRDSARWGPFRLAFLEALLRVADVRASLREKES